MKIKELKTLREKSIQELRKLLDKKILEIMQVKTKIKVSKEKNLKHVKMLKRDISQINTILREKELIEQDSEKKKENESEV